MWLELEIARAGAEMRLRARGSRGEETPPLPLHPQLDFETLRQFAATVRGAALRGKALPPDALQTAQSIARSLLGPEVDPLRARLAEAAGGPLLLRLMLPEPELAAIPWEALCKSGEALGFWASSPDLLPIRRVTTTEPWQARAVRGSVRVLAIAPTGGASLSVLKTALAPQIGTGEIEWLEPLEGAVANASAILERLRQEPVPHILHFLGHGGIDQGVPMIRVADTDDGDESWLPVELLAQQLKASLRGYLRLVVLECCEGAKPSVFASAAEILGRAGADAVVAHLWPVKADVARALSAELYRALAGQSKSHGDVARAANEARRAILGSFEGSAQAFSPVVYLRGPDGVIFDFKGRKVAPPVAAAAPLAGATGSHLAIARLVEKPFALVMGDRSRQQRPTIVSFRDKLQKDLAKASVLVPPDMSMSAITQRFALHRGPMKLSTEFQKSFRGAADPPDFVSALARLVEPGVHTTLLRHPWLEASLAEQQPERTIYVIQRGEEGAILMRREAGCGDGWEELDRPPAEIDVEKDIIIFRPYGGYTPEQVFVRPLLTEDDYVLGLDDIERVLPQDVANTLFSALSYRPALLLGLSLHTIHHRMLLHRMFPRGIPKASVAVLDPQDGERALWERGAGLPGKGDGVEVIEIPMEELGALLSSREGLE